MADRRRRWRTVRLLVWIALATLALKLGYFTAMPNAAPQALRDAPEGLAVEFTVDRSAVLTLESCVSGSWSVRGGTDEIRVNGGDWGAPAAGDYEICNQPDLSPTLEFRLPSTAIASYRLDVAVIFGEGLHLFLLIALLFSVMYIVGVQRWSNRALALLIALTQGGLALFYQATTNLRITHTHAWGQALHTLPIADLQHDLWQSFLYLHNQPPLFSIFGMALNWLSGGAIRESMYIVYVSLSLLMCVMSFHILLCMTQNKTFAFFTSLLLALNPAYFLYQALALYTLLCAFFVLACAFCLLQYQRGRRNRFLLLFVFCLNLLILTRSVYHIFILIPAILLVGLLAQRGARRLLAGCLLICLLSLSWYGKNWLVTGSFSASSYLGMNLWKIASSDYDANELVELYQDGVLTSRLVIWHFVFLPPSEYPGYAPQDSGVRITSGDNSNNIVYLELEELYLENALRLIRQDPGRYLKGALRAYGYYSCPSSTWDSLGVNLDEISASHQALSVRLFHMQELAQRAALPSDPSGVCSNLYFIMPLLALALPLHLLLRCRLRRRCWGERIRRDAPLAFIWAMVTYTAVITSLGETYENARYKFMIEAPLFIAIAVIGYRLLRLLREGLRAHESTRRALGA